MPISAADEQEEGERAIFGLFAEAARLNCLSIESRKPPEPDILCAVAGYGAVAFELGEVVNPGFERVVSEHQRLRRQFRDEYVAIGGYIRERIETCLGGPPAVFVAFGVQPGRWRRAVKPIVDYLVAHVDASDEERLRPGDVPVWRYPELSAFLSEMTVRSSTLRKPFLGVAQAVEVVDATATLLEKKFGRPYKTDAPIELVIYWAASPPPRTEAWRDGVLHLIRERLPKSPFRRVWCFDLFKSAVAMVYPAP